MNTIDRNRTGPRGDRSTSSGPRTTGAGRTHPTLWAALREVRDPELPISLVDLGLIYAIERDGSRVSVDLTFTATACPCMDFIRQDIRTRLLEEPGVEDVEIREVWDPPWTTDRLTPEGRALLRSYGVGSAGGAAE